MHTRRMFLLFFMRLSASNKKEIFILFFWIHLRQYFVTGSAQCYINNFILLWNLPIYSRNLFCVIFRGKNIRYYFFFVFSHVLCSSLILYLLIFTPFIVLLGHILIIPSHSCV